jgi:hypothetical protein
LIPDGNLIPSAISFSFQDKWQGTIDKGLIPISKFDRVFCLNVFESARADGLLSHFVSSQPQGLKLRLGKLETHTLRFIIWCLAAISFSFLDKGHFFALWASKDKGQ